MLKKNTKKFKRSRKQYLKQKGGAAQAAPPVSKKSNVNTKELFTKALAYCSTESRNYTGIIELLNEIFMREKIKNFALDVSLKDPFLESDISDPEYYSSWYKTKLGIPEGSTEELKNMNHPSLVDTLKIPEMKTLLAQIARDCLIMLITNRRNLDNQYRSNNNLTKFREALLKQKDKLDSKIKQIQESIEDIRIQQDNTQLSEVDQRTLLEYLELAQHDMKLSQRKSEDVANNLSRIDNYNNNNSNKNNNMKVKILSKRLSDDLPKYLNDLLAEINKCILEDYKYSQILKIIITFVVILSENYNVKEQIEKLYSDYLNTPCILFPTYRAINFQNVVLLISAPIINFRLSNRMRSVHGSFHSPLYDFNHDITFHARKTHRFEANNSFTYFKTTNEILKLLFPSFYCTDCNAITDKQIYDKELLLYKDLINANKQNVMALLLFTIMHEKLAFASSYKNDLWHYDEEKKRKLIEEINNEVSNNMFDRKYPFVRQLDWESVVDAFVKLIADLNKNGNKYDNLVAQLPDD